MLQSVTAICTVRASLQSYGSIFFTNSMTSMHTVTRKKILASDMICIREPNVIDARSSFIIDHTEMNASLVSPFFAATSVLGAFHLIVSETHGKRRVRHSIDDYSLSRIVPYYSMNVIFLTHNEYSKCHRAVNGSNVSFEMKIKKFEKTFFIPYVSVCNDEQEHLERNIENTRAELYRL
jgi:hypothetical protein